MKKILKIVFNRWTLTALGLLAISLLIWFVGPLIAVAEVRPLESARVRWVLIALVVLGYLGKRLWEFIKVKRLNAHLMEGLQRQAPAPPQQESAGAQEVSVLSQRFAEAIEVLKGAKLGDAHAKQSLYARLTRQKYVYELPWYVFIGAPGSGKTTALVNSGLQFPLAERFGQDPIRGIGGTRNCDWWFTESAVLLDTAGRYTTQESDQAVDSAAWSGFLELLKKYRPRRPINGIIVTISVKDLLEQNAAQREAQASAVRKRIHELHQQINIRFPIYVLVTKMDLLAGFMEFFGEYGREERAQVWGTSFPYEEGRDGATLAMLPAELQALEQRLEARLLDRMQQERDPQRRALLYAFPQQFSLLQETLNDYLAQVFSTSRFEQAPLVRGVYFTSGTQEGSPIDHLMGGLARALRVDSKLLPSQKPSGKSFFLTRLLRDVILAEAGLAGTNLRWERRRVLLQRGAYALAGALAVVAMLAWSLSYTRNRTYVAQVAAKIPPIEHAIENLSVTGDADVVNLLPVFAGVRELAGDAEHASWSMGFGLYQGDKLTAASNRAYQRLLQDVFLPRLAVSIEQDLRISGRANPELAYEALKAYVMLNSPEHFDPVALKAFITADWEANLPRSVTLTQREELDFHLDNLLARGQLASPLPADAQLIADARAMLAQTPIAQRIYNRLKRQGVGANIPEFTIAQSGGPSAPLVFVRASGKPLTVGVPGLFTFDGYYKAFAQASADVTQQLASEEDWVLGLKDGARGQYSSAQARTRLVDEVRRLYLEDYARTWETFISDIKLVNTTTLQQSIQAARALSAADSPLPLLMRAMVHEVTLVKVDEADKSVFDRATERVQSAGSQLGSFFGRHAAPVATATATARPESIVDDRFDALRRMVRAPAPGQPAPIDNTAALINELYTMLTAADAAVKSGGAPPQSDLPNKIKAEAGRMPEPMRSMLTTLSVSGTSQAMGTTRVNLGMSLNASIGEFCNRAIAGRYPFAKASSRDVTQDDFARMFAPGGMMDDFFQKNLAQYVDTATRPWSFRKVGDASIGSASSALEQFHSAQVIRDVFFGGGHGLSLRLQFKPLDMDDTITQFILDVDGQLVKYSHGPQVPTPVQWPGPRGSMQVRVQITPPSANGTSGEVYGGPWALFRMLDRAQIAPTSQQEKFNVTFNVEGRKARFEVITSSVQNPFRLRELDQFRCPERL